MSRPKLPAHLLTRLGKKACSLCGQVFPKNVQPSLSKAFAKHVREQHKLKPDPLLKPDASA
jgi:hypothetical protein